MIASDAIYNPIWFCRLATSDVLFGNAFLCQLATTALHSNLYRCWRSQTAVVASGNCSLSRVAWIRGEGRGGLGKWDLPSLALWGIRGYTYWGRGSWGSLLWCKYPPLLIPSSKNRDFFGKRRGASDFFLALFAVRNSAYGRSYN